MVEARHGLEALERWRERAGAVDVVLTDVRMPELDGRELAARLRAERPSLPVVLMSGYASEEAAAAGLPFVAKPFATADLLRAVREAIDGGAARPVA